MPNNELWQLSAVEIAAAVRAKKVSPVEVTRRALASDFPVTTNPCGEITLHVTGAYQVTKRNPAKISVAIVAV